MPTSLAASMKDDFKSPRLFHRFELRFVRSARRGGACILIPAWLSVRLALLVIFGSLTYLGRADTLRPHVVFFCFGMYQSLRGSCTIYISNAFQYMAETGVVLERVQVCLNESTAPGFGCYQPLGHVVI